MLQRCVLPSEAAATSAPPARRSSVRWTKRCGWCWRPPRRRSLPPLLKAEVGARRKIPTFPVGILNVDKAAGDTSFAVVNRLRRLTGANRVGHAGTLDPLATGVLPILFESATRLAEFALKLPKTYVADVHLGFRTATDDAEGELEAVAPAGGVTEADVRQALRQFIGRI